MSQIENIEQKIAQTQKDLAEYQEQLALAKQQSPDKAIAAELHGLLCTWNHTDGCGWFYEFKDKKDDWAGHAHSRYLVKAQKLIHQCKDTGVDPGAALSIFRLVRGL